MITGMTIARTVERLTAIARHEDAGMSLTESAALLGITARSVSRLRARRRGYKIPLKPVPTPEQLRIFESLLDEGWPYAEIGRTYGFCEQTIARYFPGRGWDRTQIGKHGAAGKLMNAIPDFAEKSPAAGTRPAHTHT
jgi:hypothetical protein